MDTYYEAYVINHDDSRWGGFQGNSPKEAILVANSQIRQKRHLQENYSPREIVVYECRPVVSLPYDTRNTPAEPVPVRWDENLSSIPEHT